MMSIKKSNIFKTLPTVCLILVIAALIGNVSARRSKWRHRQKAQNASPCGTWVPYESEKCIKIFEETKTFNEALKQCQKADASATLLVIQSVDEQSFVENLLFVQNKTQNAIWLAAKFDLNGNYRWPIDDEADLEFTNWANGSPSKQNSTACVRLLADRSVRGKWADVSCEQMNRVVCQKVQIWSFQKLQQTLIGALKRMDVNEKKIEEELALLKKSKMKMKMEMQQYLEAMVKNPIMTPRLELVKDMTSSAFAAYSQYAWGDDSLSPVSNKSNTGNFGANSGHTIVASMSTLWVMGLEEEFSRGRQWIETQFNFSANIGAHPFLFEVVPDYIGGLLSCYALTGDQMFLDKATEISNGLDVAYKRDLSLPFLHLNASIHERFDEYPAFFFVVGQYLENVYMADLTKDDSLKSKVMVIRRHLNEIEKPRGLFRHTLTASPAIDRFGRDFYRDLIKSYIQSDKTNTEALRMYLKAIDTAEKVGNIATTDSSGIAYLRDCDNDTRKGSCIISPGADYESCYGGAMIAMGGSVMKNSSEAKRHQQLAAMLTETCFKASTRTSTKLGPYRFDPLYNFQPDLVKSYSLSSELAESYFILWRLTRDSKYREYAWEMAQAINHHCRTASGGFAGLRDVTDISVGFNDHQPAEFLSATLKYLYLTFADDNVVPLDKWIINSSGHPLPICGKQQAYPKKMCRH